MFAQAKSKLDTTTFVVLGEGLAAGMANYGLSLNVQDFSFPAQMARQMKTIFPQPLIQGPGLEGMFGLPTPVARVPTYPQTTVRVFPVNPNTKPGDVNKPSLFVFNLSLPNWRLADSLTGRPTWPIIQSANPQQTTINLILGAPALLLENNVPLWTQLEYAQAMNPTLALVELGYYEALDAAASGNPDLIPDAATFRNNYTTIVKALRALYTEVVVTTIPDPTATAYFSSPATVARLLRTQVSVLTGRYGLPPEDFVTRPGLYAISNQLLTGTFAQLPLRSILRGATAAEIRARVNALNVVIGAVAKENGAVVHDLNTFLGALRASGFSAGGQRLTADYLGGFYSLDGVYPSITGHALIANDILRLLNTTYGQSFTAVDLAPLLAADPALFYKAPQ
jgi:hypothetical protein